MLIVEIRVRKERPDTAQSAAADASATSGNDVPSSDKIQSSERRPTNLLLLCSLRCLASGASISEAYENGRHGDAILEVSDFDPESDPDVPSLGSRVDVRFHPERDRGLVGPGSEARLAERSR